MNALLRDRAPTIVHIDEDVIRATKGLQEFFAQPTVVLRASYAVPQPSSDVANGNGNANGDEDAGSGSTRSAWLAGAALDAALKDEQEFGARWEQRWPFRVGTSAEAVDWEGREYLLTTTYALLGITPANNTSPLLLLPPPTLMPLDEQALYTQIAFEQLNVPGFSIVPAPLAALYALNAVTGLVLHVGRAQSTVFVIVDSVVRWEACAVSPLGTARVALALSEVLARDEGVEGQLRGIAAEAGVEWSEERYRGWTHELGEWIWSECTDADIAMLGAGGKKVVLETTGAQKDEGFDIAKKLTGDAQPAPVKENSHKSKKNQQKDAAAAEKATQAAATKQAVAEAEASAKDIIYATIPSFPGKEFAVGRVRHRLAEAMFEGAHETLPEALGRAVASEALSTAERISVWEGIGVIGDVARFKTFQPALGTYLAPFLLSSTELPAGAQPSKARLLSIPNYFVNFARSTNDLAPFLGASMVAKVAFTEQAGKHYISKVDYNARGPAAIYAVTSESG